MLPNIQGCGNILIPAVTEFAGIGFTKLQKFAEILKLRFIGKTNYYESILLGKKINMNKSMKFESQ